MNEYDFPWDHVQSFLATLEHGSLMAAARASGVSQPTLGRHIAELEARWRIVLFERTGRGLTPTVHALRLAETARAMAEQAAQLGRLATGAERSLQGRVRVTASQTVACVLLPPVLAQLRQTYPDIEIELLVSNTVSNLLRREADIALRMIRPQQSTLVARKIAEIPIYACAHQQYLRQRGVPLQFADLLEHDLITGDANDEVTPAISAYGLTVEKLRFGLRSDDLLAQWQAVRAGLGVGFATSFILRTDPQVQMLLPELPLPRLPIWLTVHRELHTSARIRAVYDFLAHQLPLALAEAPQGAA
ncbi:LysR family transcriptional regulator [Chitinibacter sp. FCG-7]|uniref:LysR family transcriptional regulator n=1 Tax=Chitinibacter mangrovi TaxID=3153927 RepID=A0AAU7FCQ1_9NEIS